MASVAVLHGSPLLRAGVVAAFQGAGLPVEEPEEADRWARTAEGVGLVEVRSPPDWRTLAALARQAKVLLVALLPQLDLEGCRRALSAGASGVASLSSGSAAIIDVTVAALRGDALLPVPLLRSALLDPPELMLSDGERDLLRRLVFPDSISHIASQAHVSVRTQSRRLADLYKRLGVTSRRGAVEWSQQHPKDEEEPG